MKSKHPTPETYQQAAELLECDPLALCAIAEVEAGPHGAFDDQDRPIILFERHVFSRLTEREYDDSHPDISNRQPGGYGKVSEQHDRLAKAAALDRPAALRSCSWGLYQLMGFNHPLCGHPVLQDFINAMYRSVDDQLWALVRFLTNRPPMVEALRERNWRRFAALYNGPEYSRNAYDLKMEQAYARLA